MSGLLALLQEFYRDKLTSLFRHQAGAMLIGQYDANNAYQYLINRDETHLSWVAAVIADLGGTIGQDVAPVESRGAGTAAGTAHAVLAEDAREAQALVDRWRPRLDTMGDARARGVLRVILGETLEEKRFFEQALAGQTDLLGRRASQMGPPVGKVLATRWIG